MLEIYGLEHILFLLIMIPMMFFSLYMMKKYMKKQKTLNLTVRLIGVFYLLIMVWNRVVVSYYEVGFDHLLPSLYCGISSIALAICLIILPRNHAIFHCLIYIGLLGGLLTLIYPDFIVHSDSLFYGPTISGLIHHSLLVFVPLMLVYMGYVKPDLKKFYILPIGLSIYVSLGVFQITVMGYDTAMYLFNPAIPNTSFNWVVLALMFFPTHLIFLIIWTYLPDKFHPKSLSEININ